MWAYYQNINKNETPCRYLYIVSYKKLSDNLFEEIIGATDNVSLIKNIILTHDMSMIDNIVEIDNKVEELNHNTDVFIDGTYDEYYGCETLYSIETLLIVN